MTMTLTKKSIQQSLVALLYRRERRGHDPAKKSLLKLVWLALLARFALYTLLMTVCSTSDHKEKHVEKKHRLYAELIAELLLLSKKLHVFNFYFDLFLTLCCVMLATSSVARSHSIDVFR